MSTEPQRYSLVPNLNNGLQMMAPDDEGKWVLFAARAAQDVAGREGETRLVTLKNARWLALLTSPSHDPKAQAENRALADDWWAALPQPATPPPDALRPSVTWKGADRTAIVLMAPIVDGLCSGCGTKPTRETGSCRCLFRVDESIRQPATPPPDALREALDRMRAEVTRLRTDPDRPPWYANGIEWALLSIEAALRAQGVVQSPETLASSVTPQEVHDAMTLAGVGCSGTHSLGYATCQTIARALSTPVDESRDPIAREGEGDTTR